jgi:hypothetical protein
MNNNTRILDEKLDTRCLLRDSSFVIPSCFVIRHSSF